MGRAFVNKLARNYIDGQWTDSTNADIADSLDPACAEVIGQASRGSTKLAIEAVSAARRAFDTSDWSADPRLRAAVLSEFADRLEEKSDNLAELLVRENGKILGQARHEIAAGHSEARYYAGLARNIFGRTFESGPGRISLLAREPAGVASVIVPWNAPVTLLVRSVAPALAAGCTVVIKPAPQTPLVNAEVIRCFSEIVSLPRGVVNSVNENGTAVGEAFSTHPGIDVVSFTGSARTGKIVMANAASTLKRLSLELGGKAPAIVFPDADIDSAISEIRRAIIVLTGQMCTAVSRVLVHEQLLPEISSKLRNALENVNIGHGLEANVEMGPLIDRPNQRRILEIIATAASETDVILRGRAPVDSLREGAFVTPTIFATDDVRHPLVQEELFGPIVSLESFGCEQEAVFKANATRYGLASSVYTRDLNRAMRLGRKLKFGTVWLNSHNRLFAEAETGGYRMSGFGRLHGVEALNDFLETKHIYLESSK